MLQINAPEIHLIVQQVRHLNLQCCQRYTQSSWSCLLLCFPLLSYSKYNKKRTISILISFAYLYKEIHHRQLTEIYVNSLYLVYISNSYKQVLNTYYYGRVFICQTKQRKKGFSINSWMSSNASEINCRIRLHSLLV